MLKSSSRQLVAICFGATIALSTPVFASGKNLVAGTWLMVSAKADPDGENRDLFSPNPSGLLIFTQDLRFSDVLVNPEVPSFASSDRAMGTAAENKAVVAGDLALYGTYTVDEQGRFATEHVIASTFPNWTGLRRDTGRIHGNRGRRHDGGAAEGPRRSANRHRVEAGKMSCDTALDVLNPS